MTDGAVFIVEVVANDGTAPRELFRKACAPREHPVDRTESSFDVPFDLTAPGRLRLRTEPGPSATPIGTGATGAASRSIRRSDLLRRPLASLVQRGTAGLLACSRKIVGLRGRGESCVSRCRPGGLRSARARQSRTKPGRLKPAVRALSDPSQIPLPEVEHRREQVLAAGRSSIPCLRIG